MRIGPGLAMPRQTLQPAVAKPPMEHLLAAFLMTPVVQGIDFRFGHMSVLPAGYRAVAEALFKGAITIEVDPVRLAGIKTETGGSISAMYVHPDNLIVVPRHDMMTDDEDRVTLFHEATHASQDRIKQVVSRVQDEGATQVAEMWLRLDSNISVDKKNEIVREVGTAMHARRGTSFPVVATENEIYRMNFVVRTVGGIVDGPLIYDGY